MSLSGRFFVSDFSAAFSSKKKEQNAARARCSVIENDDMP